MGHCYLPRCVCCGPFTALASCFSHFYSTFLTLEDMFQFLFLPHVRSLVTNTHSSGVLWFVKVYEYDR